MMVEFWLIAKYAISNMYNFSYKIQKNHIKIKQTLAAQTFPMPE